MKVAISCQGQDATGALDPRFGRAAGFIIHDTDSGEQSYLSNDENMALSQGAGIQAAMHVSSAGAQAVITGHVGPKAFQALAKGNIAVYLAPQGGTVAQALDEFDRGNLAQAEAPNVEGHWG
ncbi:MAG: dinitrogenase iron-molybdenum cofactor biosynthesis protein [Desulfovibrio sp.]|nr:MAG: dinitrogenase iron-molybdenum cofactor biosynthesis protein [Desulfovibrio sp.]